MSSHLSSAIDALISDVEALDVLQSLGARNIRTQPSGWIIHSCLIDTYDPHHANGDNNPSAALDSETKRYSCFSYGVIPLRKLLGMAFDKEVEIYEFLLGHEMAPKAPLRDQLLEAMGKELAQKPVFLDPSILEVYSQSCDYMVKDRGIPQTTLNKHNVRYDPETNSVVIPLFEDDALLGIQRRNLSRGKPKYSNSKLFHKEFYVYYTEGARSAEEIVVVESVMSALKLSSFGYPAVAVLGSIVFDEQVSKLLQHKRIILWLDDDRAGIKGARSFIQRAGTLADIRVVISDIRGKDPADMTEEQVHRNIGNAMPLLVAKPFIDSAFELLKGL